LHNVSLPALKFSRAFYETFEIEKFYTDDVVLESEVTTNQGSYTQILSLVVRMRSNLKISL